MARIEISGEALTVHVTGMDQIWSLKSQLEIPLQHVVRADVDHDVARHWWKGFRIPGTDIPGVLTAGTFYKHGERVFWDVHDPDKTIVIHLAHESYARLIVQVDEPELTAASINRALDRRG